MVSTMAIIASSVCLFIAAKAVKKGQSSLVKLSLGLAFALGLVFGVSQFIGWSQLVEKGSTVTGGIINSRGKYGKYFTLIYEGKEVTYENGAFFIKNEAVSEEVMAEMKAFSSLLMEGAHQNSSHQHIYKLRDYGTKFSLRYENTLMTCVSDNLQINGVNLNEVQHDRLWHFAENIVNDRGDFIIRGAYGKDFVIYYGGEPLDYTNRKFYLKGLPLSPKNLDALNSQDNTASSYIYAFTGVHLLHWIGGIIALLVMFIKGLQVKYSKEDYLGIKLGSIYWHFLGILWLYLYAFLIFIH